MTAASGRPDAVTLPIQRARQRTDSWTDLQAGGDRPDLLKGPIAMDGANALMRTLVESGITTLFTNPGTDRAAPGRGSGGDFRPEISPGPVRRSRQRAADGYGRIAGRPAATLVHLGPGQGNAWANFHTARRAHTPIVSLIGDHATYHKRFDPPLESDIAAVARALDSAVRTPRTEQVSSCAASAVADAASAPGASPPSSCPLTCPGRRPRRWPPRCGRHRPVSRPGNALSGSPPWSARPRRPCCCSAGPPAVRRVCGRRGESLRNRNPGFHRDVPGPARARRWPARLRAAGVLSRAGRGTAQGRQPRPPGRGARAGGDGLRLSGPAELTGTS